MMRFSRRVRPTRRGDFELRLAEWERDALRELPAELRSLMAQDDPALDRLFPPAYPDDPLEDAEYRSLTSEDLKAQKLSSLQVMESTVGAALLDEDQMVAWLGAVNDLRLVLGTRLEVTEDMDPEPFAPADPRARSHALYQYLTFLQDQIVEALAEGVDPAGTRPDDEEPPWLPED